MRAATLRELAPARASHGRAPGRIACVLIGFVLAACVHIPARFATFGDASCRTITVQAPTGSWGAGGHSPGIYRETDVISIRLGSATAEPRYAADRIVVLDSMSAPIALSAGYVEVDPRSHRVVIALVTATGDFWANGTYPLR